MLYFKAPTTAVGFEAKRALEAANECIWSLNFLHGPSLDGGSFLSSFATNESAWDLQFHGRTLRPTSVCGVYGATVAR